MSKITNKEIREEFLKAIEAMIEKRISSLKFNTTLEGKVISFSNNVARVLADDIEYNCECKITVGVGDSVRVIAPNNNFKKLYVDAKK